MILEVYSMTNIYTNECTHMQEYADIHTNIVIQVIGESGVV